MLKNRFHGKREKNIAGEPEFSELDLFPSSSGCTYTPVLSFIYHSFALLKLLNRIEYIN